MPALLCVTIRSDDDSCARMRRTTAGALINAENTNSEAAIDEMVSIARRRFRSRFLIRNGAYFTVSPGMTGEQIARLKFRISRACYATVRKLNNRLQGRQRFERHHRCV